MNSPILYAGNLTDSLMEMVSRAETHAKQLKANPELELAWMLERLKEGNEVVCQRIAAITKTIPDVDESCEYTYQIGLDPDGETEICGADGRYREEAEFCMCRWHYLRWCLDYGRVPR